jgi:hypothetical protein
MPKQDPPRIKARAAIQHALHRPKGQAEQLVAELTDDEVASVVAARGDKPAIEVILAKAHDRRSEHFAAEARLRQVRLRRSGLARKVLERELGMHVVESVAILPHLDEAEREALASLQLEHDVADQCRAVLQPALARLQALANTRHVNAGDVDVLERYSTGIDPLDGPPAAAHAASDVELENFEAIFCEAESVEGTAPAAETAEPVPEHPDSTEPLVGTGEP